MRRYLFIILFTFLIFANSSQVFAESSYVLPYPSVMPGSIFYKLNLIQEALLKFWYFGDFGQFKYNLQESDKYLVEAKTLFDYKQYLLGYKALLRSDSYFEKIQPALALAKKHRKDISEKSEILKEAARKHIEELQKLKNNLPESYEWRPEKSKATNLELWKEISRSIIVRSRVL